MREVFVKRIALSSYKGTSAAEYELYKRTLINGRNGSGKSTIKDAIMEILTGKLADGTAPDNIRPHDKDGNDIHHVDVRRGIVVDVDGTETEVIKTTRERWTQHRGQSQEVFEGNATTYQIDGFETKPKDFSIWLAQIADPDTMLMCMNANPFLARMAKSTAEARKLLEKLSGFSIEDFIIGNPQYEEIAGMLKGHTVEDLLKKFRKDFSLQSKETDRIRTNLEFEKGRASEGADSKLTEKLAEMEADKRQIEAQISAIGDPREAISKLHSEIVKLTAAINDKENEVNADLLAKRDAALIALRTAETEVSNLEIEVRDMERQISSRTSDISVYQRKAASEEQLLESTKAVKYEPTHRRSVCKYSGQKCEYLANADAKAEAAEKAEFEAERKANIKLIQDEIKSCRDEIKKLERQIKALEKDWEGNRQKLEAAKAKAEQERESFKHLPSKVGRERIPECVEMMRQISEMEKKQASLASERDRERALIARRDSLSADIQRVKLDIAEAEGVRKDHAKTVVVLEGKLKESVQYLADIQRKIDMVSEFSMAKNAALAEKVNSHFNGIHFEFTDTNMDGSVYETLKLMRDGTEYSAMSGSEKKLAEFELCRGLQDMNDILLPLFLDEASVIDTERLPKDCKQQVIIIQRSDDDKVVVKEV